MAEGVAYDLFGEVPAGAAPGVSGRGPKGGKRYIFNKTPAGWRLKVPPHDQEIRVNEKKVEDMIEEVRSARHTERFTGAFCCCGMTFPRTMSSDDTIRVYCVETGLLIKTLKVPEQLTNFGDDSNETIGLQLNPEKPGAQVLGFTGFRSAEGDSSHSCQTHTR